MIRRWSRLNFLNFFNTFHKASKIEIFKSSVHFKKFLFKFTKFKRKKISKWKHHANWFPYLHLFKFWCLDYLTYAKIAKYQFLINIFQHSFFIFNSNYLKKNLLTSFNNPFDFNSIAITKKIYFYLVNVKHLILIKNGNLLLAFTPSTTTPLLNNSINFLTWNYERTVYEPLEVDLNQKQEVFFLLYDVFFQIILQKINEMYKIFVILWYLFLLKR